MIRILSSLFSFCITLQFILVAEGFCAKFDERLWEKYAEIKAPTGISNEGLAGLYLEPQQIGDIFTKVPFADFRIITDQKEEVPWHIVATRTKQREIEVPHEIQNSSLTPEGDTWLEIVFDKQPRGINAVEIMTDEFNFSRQVEIFGSADGKTWNIVRNDGVIFDLTKNEKFRHTRITFPQTGFRYLALKINNGNTQPFKINGVKVFQRNVLLSQSYIIQGTIEKHEINTQRQESSIVVRMNTAFPVDQLVITTPEQNFQRSVEVQIKRDNKVWTRLTYGTIFNLTATNMRETRSTIDLPEIVTKEFRLVFKDFDSPPLSVTNVTGYGYRRLLVFKQQSDKRLYLFWGNPLAHSPLYDLAEIVAKQNTNELPLAKLGQPRANTKFEGNKARLPFTERYKYLLYILVILGITGLVFLQYRVFRNGKEK